MQRTVALLLWLALPSIGIGQDWPNWRGPGHDGSSTITGLPRAIGEEGGIRWRAALPGTGASTPIVVGDRVFLTAVDHEADALLAICVNAESGELSWKKSVGSGYRPGGEDAKGEATRIHNRSDYASPSAVSDGEHVVFLFGNGDLVCLDVEGESVWRQNLQETHGDFAFQWTFGASPTLWNGRLFLPILQRNEPANGLGKQGAESFLLALDVASGKQLYRHVRPSDAVKESLESYATAIPYTSDEGREELLIIGGDVITGHDPATGKELWRWGTWNAGHREVWWRVVPSPVVGGGVALVCAPKKAPVYAVPLGGEGTLPADGVAWESSGRPNPVSSDVPTPLYYQDAFFVLSDVQSCLSRVDPQTGEVAWTRELPKRNRWRGSPTGADGLVWCIDHGALLIGVDAESGEILVEAALGNADDDQVRASVAAARGSLYVRTEDALIRIAK